MSFNSIVSTQVEKSHKRLSLIKKNTGYLLEHIILTLDKQGIEPLASTEVSLQSASAILNSAAKVETEDSNIFLNRTTKRIKDKCFGIVGRSPGLIEDIVDKVVTPIKKLIKDAIKPLTDTIGAIGSTVKGFVDKATTFITNGFKTAVTTIQDWIGGGFKLLGGIFDFLKSSIMVILDGIAEGIETFKLTLKLVFKELLEGFEKLMKVTPEAIVALQTEVQRLIQEAQADMIKKTFKTD